MEETRVRSLEESMETHYRILAQKIPGTEEYGGLQSIGAPRAGHNWSDLAHKQRKPPQIWIRNQPFFWPAVDIWFQGLKPNANKHKTLLFTSRSWEENEEMYRNIVLLLEKWLKICDLMTVIFIRNSSYVKIISRHPSTVPHLSQMLTIQFHLIY